VEKCATMPKKNSRFTTSEKEQNGAELPDRLPPTKKCDVDVANKSEKCCQF